jgi:hypothetical protein
MPSTPVRRLGEEVEEPSTNNRERTSHGKERSAFEATFGFSTVKEDVKEARPKEGLKKQAGRKRTAGNTIHTAGLTSPSCPSEDHLQIDCMRKKGKRRTERGSQD